MEEKKGGVGYKTNDGNNIGGARNIFLEKANGYATIRNIMETRPAPHHTMEEATSNQERETAPIETII